MTEGNHPAPSDSYVQSFARGLSVIQAFGAERPQMTLSEVAAHTGLTRAGARRILLTLEQLGYVRSEERKFFLTPKILDLGYAYLSATPLWDLATPFMEEVANATHESCSISVLDGLEIVYILRIATHKIMTVNLSVGSRLPAWVTSMGRVMLGGLAPAARDDILARSTIVAHTPHTLTDPAEIRKAITTAQAQGYAFVAEELEAGLQSIAVPIFDRNRRIIAAMNVSGHASRNSREQMLKEFLPCLKQAAERLSATLQRR
ncbi:IclR family transcriptional regulator [Pandoraea sp.]|uniref:IclR family transcriptional regulator n=1 Tax=Pandoraea sp. TaxID=1883445 RepID=UPI00122818E4|nr:IclR family transcriptional regulator [Pandoraea sp.]TAL52821.1 MAG: IclR family transcriptional regulator [Pandoraea sp.]TAM19734.1 MAG: IclR family transcriptional regulator [Pandoraea sp.]